MYLHLSDELMHGMGTQGLAQMSAANDETQYRDIVTRIQAQLDRRFSDPNDPELYQRRKELRRLFSSVPTSYAKTLQDRLQSSTDTLGRRFRYKLATATRNEMLGILKKKLSGSPLSPPSTGRKARVGRKHVSRQTRSLARKITRARQLLTKASKFLKTRAQRELLGDMLYVLSSFFPTGYGVINAQDKEIKPSKRNRLEVINKDRLPGQPLYFHYDTLFHLSQQKSVPDGIHRPFAPYHRNWIRLSVRNLRDAPVPYIAEAVVHEMMHMALHRFRSIRWKFGSDPARNYPSAAAGHLLDVSSFAAHRRVMERHFQSVLELFNRHPSRSGGLPLEPDVVSRWADLIVDEVMAFVFQERVRSAVARGIARGQNIVETPFIASLFLKRYFRKYWLRATSDLAVLNSKEAEKIFSKMIADVEKFVRAVRAHMGP